MKTHNAIFLLLLPFLLILGSCVIPESNHVQPTFYLLSELATDGNKSHRQSEASFHLRQVELPTYLQDNRLVSRPDKGVIEFREADRWGEPLEEGIARVVGLNLGKRLNTLRYSVYPHRKKVPCSYELSITIRRFERIGSGAILLEAICEIHSADQVTQERFLKKIELGEPDTGKEDVNEEVMALSKAMSACCDSIVQRLAALPKKVPDE